MHLPGTFALAAGQDGALRGCALTRALVGEAEILVLVVAPDTRRQGLGAALLARVLEAAAAAGAREIHLEVNEANAPAQALYRAAGFAESGRRARYYKDGADALVLSRALAPD
jgi:ribosomal-protein-alanine N-acetyltransferase